MKKKLSILVLVGFAVLLNSCKETGKNYSSESEWNKKIVEAYVHSYAGMIGHSLPLIKDDSLKIEFIQKVIDEVRFYPDSSGYFYVYDFDCVNIAHARQKDIVGKNLYNYKDIKGKYVIRELSKAAQSGSGYVDFYWIKPGTEKEKEKLGYVERIPGTNYFIGSGVYLE